MQLAYIFTLLYHLTLCFGKTYNSYKLLRGTPINDEHLDFFNNISSKYEVNFWKDPGKTYMPIDFIINPKHLNAFVEEADNKGIYLTTILRDVQEAFDNQTVKTYVRRKMDTFNWESYYRLDDIYGWLDDLQSRYPDEVSLIDIGRTIMKRKILGVRLALKGSKMRSKVIIEGGIHAREWISQAFVTYLINELVHARTSSDKKLKKIALTYEWFFVPVVNPDGYELTHTKDRMWRKNLRKGYGIDLNRNFDAAFGSVGVSKNTNSESYCGKHAFSEPESTALNKFIKRNSNNLEYYIAFHSYGQLFIIPYAYTKEHLDNFDVMKVIGDNAAAKISRRYGTRYAVGTAYDTVGITVLINENGMNIRSILLDIFANIQIYRRRYVATLELRDEGDYGFALPPKYILPTCRETMDGILEVLEPKTRDFKKLTKEQIFQYNHKEIQIGDVLVVVLNMILVLVFK